MRTTRSSKSRAGSASAKTEFAPRVILTPVDFSELSSAALARARQIARQFGATVHLVHAVEPIIQPVEFAIVPPAMEEVNMRLVAERKKRLEATSEGLRAEGISCEAVVKLGKPWHVITELAKRLKADLIVIATHGHTGPKHLLLGSTAERVVQHAPCSVLVVR
jgi:universal stress protein A